MSEQWNQRPTNDSARLPAGTEEGAWKVNSQTNFPPAAKDSQEESQQDKAFARIRAELAQRGWCMYRLHGAGYLISRWGRGREVADLADAERFLRQVGGGR